MLDRTGQSRMMVLHLSHRPDREAEPSARLGVDVVSDSVDEMEMLLRLSKGCNLHISVSFYPFNISRGEDGTLDPKDENELIGMLWRSVDVLRPYAYQIWWMRLAIDLTDRTVEPIESLLAVDTPRWTHLDLDDSLPAARLTRRLDLGQIPDLRSLKIHPNRTISKILLGAPSHLEEFEVKESIFHPARMTSADLDSLFSLTRTASGIHNLRIATQLVNVEPQTKEETMMRNLGHLSLSADPQSYFIFACKIKAENLTHLDLVMLEQECNDPNFLDNSFHLPRLSHLKIFVHQWSEFVDAFLRIVPGPRLFFLQLKLHKDIAESSANLPVPTLPHSVQKLRLEAQSSVAIAILFWKLSWERMESLSIRLFDRMVDHLTTENISPESRASMPKLSRLELKNFRPGDAEVFCSTLDAPMLVHIRFSNNRYPHYYPSLDGKPLKSVPFPRPRELREAGLPPGIYEKIQSLVLPTWIFPLHHGDEHPLKLFPNVRQLELRLEIQRTTEGGLRYNEPLHSALSALSSIPILHQQLKELDVHVWIPFVWGTWRDEKGEEDAKEGWKRDMRKLWEWRRRKGAPLEKARVFVRIGEYDVRSEKIVSLKWVPTGKDGLGETDSSPTAEGEGVGELASVDMDGVDKDELFEAYFPDPVQISPTATPLPPAEPLSKARRGLRWLKKFRDALRLRRRFRKSG
jgi:hypothetical protein